MTPLFRLLPWTNLFYEISAISLDVLGGISRLDYYIFTYKFASADLVAKKTCLVAYAVVESSAVVKDIDPNTLRVIINRTFKDGNLPYTDLLGIYAQLYAAMFGPTNRAQRLSVKVRGEDEAETGYNAGEDHLVSSRAFHEDAITPVSLSGSKLAEVTA